MTTTMRTMTAMREIAGTRRSGGLTCAALTLVMLGAPWLSALADATVVQQVTITHSVNGTGAGVDHDLVTGATPDDITRDILAQLGVPTAYQAVAAAGRFGSVGTSIGLFESGVFATLISEIEISADFTNVTGVAQQGTANFVIDGGSLLMIAARNASLRYTLNVRSINITQTRTSEFETFGALVADPAGQVSFITSGPDIGATFDPTTGRVALPPSFQSLDLGILDPGDQLLLTYRFVLRAAVGSDVGEPGASEGLGARFSDPLNLGTTPVLGPIQLQPVGSPPPPPPAMVPEPSTMTLCVLGASGFAALRRRHRRQP
jgi:hypothetical protein